MTLNVMNGKNLLLETFPFLRKNELEPQEKVDHITDCVRSGSPLYTTYLHQTNNKTRREL